MYAVEGTGIPHHHYSHSHSTPNGRLHHSNSQGSMTNINSLYETGNNQPPYGQSIYTGYPYNSTSNTNSQINSQPPTGIKAEPMSGLEFNGHESTPTNNNPFSTPQPQFKRINDPALVSEDSPKFNSMNGNSPSPPQPSMDQTKSGRSNPKDLGKAAGGMSSSEYGWGV